MAQITLPDMPAEIHLAITNHPKYKVGRANRSGNRNGERTIRRKAAMRAAASYMYQQRSGTPFDLEAKKRDEGISFKPWLVQQVAEYLFCDVPNALDLLEDLDVHKYCEPLWDAYDVLQELGVFPKDYQHEIMFEDNGNSAVPKPIRRIVNDITPGD